MAVIASNNFGSHVFYGSAKRISPLILKTSKLHNKKQYILKINIIYYISILHYKFFPI